MTTIGQTVQGRPLEIVRIGNEPGPGTRNPAPVVHRVFVRARAHPWEAGSNWVAQGLIERLLRDDADARRWRERYVLYVLPMANKDGVARGGTRFNVNGKDLNRNWDRPADPSLVPENAALERWLEGMIAAGRKPDLAIELHNDGRGLLHISRPPVPQPGRPISHAWRVSRPAARAARGSPKGTPTASSATAARSATAGCSATASTRSCTS